MKASRDRGKKQAGKNVRPEKISDADFEHRLGEFCRQAHRENTALLAQLQRQRQALLEYLGRRETIQ